MKLWWRKTRRTAPKRPDPTAPYKEALLEELPALPDLRHRRKPVPDERIAV